MLLVEREKETSSLQLLSRQRCLIDATASGRPV